MLISAWPGIPAGSVALMYPGRLSFPAMHSAHVWPKCRLGGMLRVPRCGRVRHLQVEQGTAVGELRRNVPDQFEGDRTVQLRIADHACREGAVGYCPASSSPSSGISESATVIARPRARRILPPAETTLAVPTTGATAIMTACRSSAVIPLSAAAPALAREGAGGAATAIRAAILTSSSSRGTS